MKFLVVNDDGFDSPGLIILVKELSKRGNVVVYSPSKCESAQSHKITLTSGIKVEEVIVSDLKINKVYGSTADCVRIATYLHNDIDVVFSGINNVLNLGYDIFYSSTIAGVYQAGLQDIKGVAFSCDTNFSDVEKQLPLVLDYYFDNLYENEKVLNINFPVKEYSMFKEIEFGVASKRTYSNDFLFKEGCYFSSGELIKDNTVGTDDYIVNKGNISITRLSLERSIK